MHLRCTAGQGGGASPRIAGWLIALAGMMALWSARPAWAVPAFAREMGVPCAVCHTVAFGPALTAYGRNFKLHGYALGTQKTVPLSADLIASYTRTAEDAPAIPHYSANDNFAIDDVDVYFAGRIANHVGAFVQVTYDHIARNTQWGVLDVRYAQDFTLGKVNTLFGLSLNNYPSVQDPWNSSPAWRSPYPSPRFTNGPAAGPQIVGFFSGTVLGGSAYTLIDDTVYLEAGGYRALSDNLQDDFGVQDPELRPHVDGTAPYWRAALQKTSGAHYFSVGLLGFSPSVQLPQATSAGTNNYTDFGYDATYQYANGGPHTFNFDLGYIEESQRLFASTNLGGSSMVDNHLNTLHVSAQYAYQQTYAATVVYFNGITDANPALYPPSPWFGSASGKPDSRYLLFQLECVPFGKASSYAHPWLNLRVGVQYLDFLRLNGGTSNYDGFGHSAHDNNALFLYVWTAI